MKKSNIKISFLFCLFVITLGLMFVSSNNRSGTDYKPNKKSSASANAEDYKKIYKNLPKHLQAMLEDNNWTIKVVSNEEMIKAVNDVNKWGYGPQGATDYDNKIIYLNTSVEEADVTLCHEIGHVFGVYNNDIDLSNECYNLFCMESDNVKDTCARINNAEFFAEVFAWVVMDNELKDKVPKSAEFIETLLKKSNAEYLKGEEIKLKNLHR